MVSVYSDPSFLEYYHPLHTSQLNRSVSHCSSNPSAACIISFTIFSWSCTTFLLCSFFFTFFTSFFDKHVPLVLSHVIFLSYSFKKLSMYSDLLHFISLMSTGTCVLPFLLTFVTSILILFQHNKTVLFSFFLISLFKKVKNLPFYYSFPH